jgi:MoxR-like ATPase
VPKKSNRLRRLGERVLVAEGDGMWQAGKIARVIEGEQGAVVYVVDLLNGSRIWAPANCVDRDPQQRAQRDPTPEEIRQRCLEIQREWPEEVRQQRDMRAQPTAWSVPRSHYLRDTQSGRMDFEH